jgi:hypothetical protein
MFEVIMFTQRLIDALPSISRNEWTKENPYEYAKITNAEDLSKALTRLSINDFDLNNLYHVNLDDQEVINFIYRLVCLGSTSRVSFVYSEGNCHPKLFFVDKNTFKVTEKIYKCNINYVTDLVFSEGGMYFFKINCPLLKSYSTYVDKTALFSFLKLDLKRTWHYSSLTLFLQLINLVIISNVATTQENIDLEKCREFHSQYLSKKCQHYRLQISPNGFSRTRYYYRLLSNSHFYQGTNSGLDKPDLYQYLKRDSDIVRFDKFHPKYDSYWQDILSRNINRRNRFFDYAIYDPDVSYYVYVWLMLIRDFDASALYSQIDKFKVLFKCIRFLEKNRRIINNLTTKGILRTYGLAFKD